MKVIELLSIHERLLLILDEHNIKIKDCLFISMYKDFCTMRYEHNEKYEYVIKSLSAKYNISVSKIKRLIKKFNQLI